MWCSCLQWYENFITIIAGASGGDNNVLYDDTTPVFYDDGSNVVYEN
jgi:hypothetical protein